MSESDDDALARNLEYDARLAREQAKSKHPSNVTPLKTKDDDDVADVKPFVTQQTDGAHEAQCVVCGTRLEWSGRGAKRKYCDEHKPKASNTRKTKTSSQSLQKQLEGALFGLGVFTSSVDQFDGAIVIASAPSLAAALAATADAHPAFAKWLMTAGDSMVYVQLAYAVAGLVVPILAHHKMIGIDEKLAAAQFHPSFAAAMSPPDAS